MEYLQAEHETKQKQRGLKVTPLNFILIGHSVGSYICLRLRKLDRFPISQVINLFPTFQYLYEGLSPFIRWLILPGFRHLASILCGIFPTSLKNYVVRQYSTGLSEESQNIVALGFNRYSVLNNVLYMARTEGQEICELDPTLIQPLDTTYFLYGTTDQYTPMEQINNFRFSFPEGM